MLMGLAKTPIVAFAPSTDLIRSRAFFEGVLGLPLREQTPFAHVFDANGTMLRVTRVDSLRVQPFTVLGWEVPDIYDAIAALPGVTFTRYEGMDQDEHGVWTAPDGSRI